MNLRKLKRQNPVKLTAEAAKLADIFTLHDTAASL